MAMKLIDGFEIYQDQIIGKGAFAVVCNCQKQGITEPLCAKVISLKGYDSFEKITFAREVQILGTLRNLQKQNQNLVKIFGVYEEDDCYFIIMEKCLNGHLEKQLLKRRKQNMPYTTAEIIDVLTQILSGYRVLYENKIIHRDLKPENLLMGNDGFIKIADFGMSKSLDNLERKQYQSKVGTPYFASPQVLTDGTYSSKTDIYSLGVIIYYMVYFNFPFEAQTINLLIMIQEKRLKGQSISLPPIKLSGNQQDIVKITEVLIRTIAYREEDRIDWKELFDKFLPNQEQILQVHSQDQLLKNSSGITPTVGMSASLPNQIKNVQQSQRSYGVKQLIDFLEGRNKLAKIVAQYLDFFHSKFQKNFNEFDKSFLNVCLSGYQSAVNKNQIGLSRKLTNQIWSQLTATLLEHSITLDLDEYANDNQQIIEDQKLYLISQEQQIEKLHNCFREKILLQLDEKIQQVQDISKFKGLIKSVQNSNYLVYQKWFQYYFKENYFKRLTQHIQTIQDSDMLMFLASACRFINVETEFPIYEYWSQDSLDIASIQPDSDILKQYLGSIKM